MFYLFIKLPENDEQSEESEEEGIHPPAAFMETKFCDWCCSYFAQSVTKVNVLTSFCSRVLCLLVMPRGRLFESWIVLSIG